MIGIVGGIGPYSGIDLLKKVFDNTLASSDQEHLDTILLSMPSRIEDRTQYLMGNLDVNPAIAIAEVVLKLEKAGATIAGIACNTAHSEKIFNLIQRELKESNSEIKILNMIQETVSFIAANYLDISKVGVLSTTGTYKTRLYSKALESKGFGVIVSTLEMQESLIHPAIYDPDYGIKSNSNPIHPQARENLLQGSLFLKGQGAQAVILGCTEIPLAITDPEIHDMITIDPSTVLARALIYNYKPHKLKPL